MKITKKKPEELQSQAEWFLDYADETWKVTEKQKNKISKVLWLNDADKKWFFKRLSEKFWKEIDISDKWEIGKALKLEKKDFDKLWEDYNEYLNKKSVDKHNDEIKQKVEAFFEPYKTPDDWVNEKIINIIAENYSKEVMEKLKIFLTSDFYKKICIEWKALHWSLERQNQRFKSEIGQGLKYFVFERDINDLKNLLQMKWDELVDNWCDNHMNKINLCALDKNIKILNEYWCDITHFKLRNLSDFDYEPFIKLLENIDFECFRRDYDPEWEDQELKDIFLRCRKLSKEDMLKECAACWSDNIDRALSKTPGVDHEYNNQYRNKYVHMFWIDSKNNRMMADYLAWRSEYDENSHYHYWLSDYWFLAFLWTVYWTNNWKKNINFMAEKWYLWTEKVQKYDDYLSEDLCTNMEITALKLVDNNKLKKLNIKSQDDLKWRSDAIISANKISYDIIIEKYPNIEIIELRKISGVVSSGSFPENFNILYNKYWLDLQAIVNSEELKVILKNDFPKNLKLIIEKYPNIEITELENISGVISSYRFHENFNILFDKYGFNLQTLINSKGLKDILQNGFSENLKIIIEYYKNNTIDELSEFPGLFIDASSNNLKNVFKYFEPTLSDELDDYEKLLFNKFYYLPGNLNFKESDHKWYLNFLNEIVDTDYNPDKKSKMTKKLVTLTFEQAKNYVKVFKMFDDSISMDIQRIKNELIDQLLETDNPNDIAQQIINIFERNNLPLTWKIFKVFELLYPIEKFKYELKPSSWSFTLWSPILNDYIGKWKEKEVYGLIYKDLMNIAIKSWDRSLRDYLNTFIWSEKLLRKFEDIVNGEWFDWNDPLCLENNLDDDEKLTEDEQAKLLYLFRRMSVLYNRFFWSDINEWNTIEDKKLWESIVADNQLVEFYKDIKKWFNLREWKYIYDRLQTLLYVNGLWYHSAQEVLDKMNTSKKDAHERWLKLYNEAMDNWWRIKFPSWAFLKWVREDAFSKIINRWITSREYLWWWDDGKDSWNEWWSWAWSDATPFDIDWILVNSPKNWTRYWPINLIIDTDRCDIVDTWNKWLNWYKENQYELFVTWWWIHYWIRTWIPTTEVDYIIFNWSFERTAKIKVPTEEHSDWEYIEVLSIFQNMCYEIARNGYYIPIVDNGWNVKFTPEMYHQIRAWFNYMQYYDWFDVEQINWKWVSKESDNEVHKEYTGTNKEKITDKKLKDLIAANSPNNEKYREFAEGNRKLAEDTIEKIKWILRKQCKITFNPKYDSSITWAELHDSWSTWRWTDIPTKDVDLDFTLLLDAKDYDEKLELIKETIYREIGTISDPIKDWAWPRTWWYQMKSKKNKLWQDPDNIWKRPNWISLDLLILKKSQVIDYSSSDAMKEKLNFINDNLWKEDLDRVRTNVIIMKKLLKSQSCYKKTSVEWWIAWIWVENWITQHHWSFIEALESFEKVAFNWEYKDWSRPIPLKEFKELYSIYDAWENYKDGCNDNFVEKINEHGYNWMLNIVIALRTKWIEWIEELIKKYERDKAEHIN